MKLFKIFLLVISVTSCKSQIEFDLAKVSMPLKQDEIPDGIGMNETNVKLDSYIKYEAKNIQKISFNDVTFEAEYSKEFFSPTSLDLYLDKGKSIFPVVELKSFDKKGAEKLYKTILNDFGQPVFYKKNEQVFYGVWEKESTSILLELNYSTKLGDEPTIHTIFRIIDNSKSDLTNYYFSAGFSKYGDYFSFKQSNNLPNLTYKEFAEQKANQMFGDDQYLNDLKDNLPL